MHAMDRQHIARLEHSLERLVEGAFAQLFGRALTAHDVALELVRALEAGVAAMGAAARPLAPDYFRIILHPEVANRLLKRQPGLAAHLGELLAELASHMGYQFAQSPIVEILGDAAFSAGQIAVQTQHTGFKRSTTAVMQRVAAPPAHDAPLNPQLLIPGRPGIALGQPLVNVGRSRDNHVIIDDPAVSRHHLQLRLRSGRYMLFDAQSRGGTRVNGVPVREHILQTGDVIQIGSIQMVYTEDRPESDAPTGVYLPAPDNLREPG